MSFVYPNSTTSLAVAVDPALFRADKTGESNSYAAWKLAIDFAIAQAPRNGGVVFIKPSPGKYRVDWDGTTGWNGWTPRDTNGWSISQTAINTRAIFVIANADVREVILDLTGCTLIQGGEDHTDWASVFYVSGAKVRWFGGTLDMLNLPFTQGTITALTDETSPGADDAKVRFQVDAEFDATQSPSFAEVSEIVSMSAKRYRQGAPERSPLQFLIDRDEYSETRAPMVEISAGIYEITITGDEYDTVAARATVGTYCIFRGMAVNRRAKLTP